MTGQFLQRYPIAIALIVALFILTSGGAAAKGEGAEPPEFSVNQSHSNEASTQEKANEPKHPPLATPQHKNKRGETIQATGESGKKIAEYRKSSRTKMTADANLYSSWKNQQNYWLRRLIVFAELALIISAGVILGQILEVAGLIRYIAILAAPILWLGKLPKAAATPFIMALQSGAVANSMLVNARDEGQLSARQLYTSVLVVSALSLFAHLPTFIIPLAMAFGTEAAGFFFGIRFLAIFLQIIVMLLVSRVIILRKTGDPLKVIPDAERLEAETASKKMTSATKTGSISTFCHKVWLRSRRTIKRLLIFLLPSFIVVTLLEHYNAFNWLGASFPNLFSYSFLPPQAAVIIPQQALSLYSGAILAGNFLDEGAINARQVVAILLCGSLVTSPIRTLRHGLQTYIAVLGPHTGTVMAVCAQALRVIFLGAATAAYIILFV